MQTENLLTAAELAQYAPSLDTSAMSATTISGMISQASQQVANYCGVDGFTTKYVTETQRVLFNTNGDLIISFRRPRVAQGALGSLHYKQRGIDYTVTLVTDGLDNYFVDPSGLFMTLPYNNIGIFGTSLRLYDAADLFAQLSYTGGYSTTTEGLPADLKQAAVLFLLAQQGMLSLAGGVKLFVQGSYREMRDHTQTSSISDAAQAILDRGGYVRMVI